MRDVDDMKYEIVTDKHKIEFIEKHHDDLMKATDEIRNILKDFKKLMGG